MALHVKIIKEKGDVAVLWCLQNDDAVHIMGVDFRPAWTLQVAVFLFIRSATAWKSPTQLEHLLYLQEVCSVPIMPTVSKPNVQFSLGLFIQEEESMKTVFCGLSRKRK